MSPGVRSILLVPLQVALATVILAAGLCATAASPAAATAPTAAAPGPTNHCVLAAGSTKATCYASFPAAIAAATGGRVRAPSDAAAAASDAAFGTAIDSTPLTSGSWVAAIEYVNASYGGGSLTLTTSGPCDNSLDADYVWNTLPAGWNDVISSFHSYSNCAQQLFRNTYRGGGALTGILSNTPYVGAPANDQASSLTAN
jgi:hypothetical protein